MLLALVLSAMVQIGYHETVWAIADYEVVHDPSVGHYVVEVDGEKISLAGAVLVICNTEVGSYYAWKLDSDHPGKPTLLILGMDPDDAYRGHEIEVIGYLNHGMRYFRIATVFKDGKFQMAEYDPR